MKLNLLVFITACAPFFVSATAAATAALASPSRSSIDTFLASALEDHKVTLQKKNQQTFGENLKAAPIESMQLRVSQNEVIEDRKFALRVKPRGYQQMRLQSSLNSGQKRLENLNSQKAVSEALLERYLAVVEYVTALETQKTWKSISDLRAKRLSMLQAAARSSQTRAADLLQTRQTTEQAEVKASLAEADVRAAAAKLKILGLAGELSVNRNELPTPADMLKVMSEVSGESSLDSSIARELAQRESESVKYDIAKDDRLIDFVEVSYSEEPYDAKKNQDQRIGFRVGINVPGLAQTELNRSEKARTLVKYEVEAREEERKQKILREQAREALTVSADLYKSLDSVDSRSSEKRLRAAVGRQDPLLANSLDEEVLERANRKREVLAKAFESYFGFLASTGTLAQRSQTNFLTRELREIRQ